MARQLLNPEIDLIKQAVLLAVDKLRGKPLDALRGIQEALEQLGGDNAQQREYAQWIVRLAIEAFRKRLREVDDLHELDKCAAMLERCAEADAHLRQSMPVALCFEALFDHFARIERNAIT
ncbi:DNA polymerase-3 subunit delta, partial [Durusdinium trenchii]